MSGMAKTCPNCGSDNLKGNGGFDGHHNGHLAHSTAHAARDGQLAWVAVGAASIVCSLIFPKKYACNCCGHVFKV
jgi:hypothetical protein